MATHIKDIHPGMTVFEKGIAFDEEDLALNADAKSKSRSKSGKGKHFGIVIRKTETEIIVAGTATFNGAEKLDGTVAPESLAHWIPVHPATKEKGMHYEPIHRESNEDLKPKWVSVRKSHTLHGTEFNVQTHETYPEASLREIIAAIGNR